MWIHKLFCIFLYFFRPQTVVSQQTLSDECQSHWGEGRIFLGTPASTPRPPLRSRTSPGELCSLCPCPSSVIVSPCSPVGAYPSGQSWPHILYSYFLLGFVVIHIITNPALFWFWYHVWLCTIKENRERLACFRYHRKSEEELNDPRGTHIHIPMPVMFHITVGL